MRLVEEQHRVTRVGTLKNLNEILFGLTDVFTDDQREAASGDAEQVCGKG